MAAASDPHNVPFADQPPDADPTTGGDMLSGTVAFWRIDMDNAYLGNWQPSYFRDEMYAPGHTFCNVEQYMMYRKARIFNDPDVAHLILRCENPKKIKALGRKVSGFVEDVWVRERFKVVYRGCYLKFQQNPELARRLVGTGNKVLVEASPLDTVWGIGLAPDNPHLCDPSTWSGLNLLGRALMAVRRFLAAPDATPAPPGETVTIELALPGGPPMTVAIPNNSREALEDHLQRLGAPQPYILQTAQGVVQAGDDLLLCQGDRVAVLPAPERSAPSTKRKKSKSRVQ